MNIGNWICDVSNRFYKRLGMRVSRIDPNDARVVTQHGTPPAEIMKRVAWIAAQLRFSPAAILDVGASDGRWARAALQVFPDARYLLVEPLAEHRDALAKLTREYPNIASGQWLVGSARGTATLKQHGFQSSVLGTLNGQDFGRPVEMPVHTLDDIAAELAFQPDYIKLDIEGGELDALRGGRATLRSAQIVQVEVSLIRFKQNLPLMDEIVAFMSTQGFRILDVVGIYGRPLDGIPVQGECFFMKKDSPLLRDLRWSADAAWS